MGADELAGLMIGTAPAAQPVNRSSLDGWNRALSVRSKSSTRVSAALVRVRTVGRSERLNKEVDDGEVKKSRPGSTRHLGGT
jgi:hypothetical protein